MQCLSRDFYNRDTQEVARDLLGKYLIHHVNNENLIGKIVEVEAYLGPHDLAAHSSKGVTKRTKIMYGPPGFAYIYLIYGIYHCMNVVTEKERHGSAVLIRAIEPIQNIHTRTQGPGLLCNALRITKELNGHDLLSSNFYIASSLEDTHTFTIVERPRIGVAFAKEWSNKLLRFYIQGNNYISKP